MVGPGGNNISHAWVEERLSAYIDNQLDALERAQLERHLRECADCRASLSSLQWSVSLLKQAPNPALPRSFTLPVPKESKRAPAPRFNLGFAARWATVVVTVLLFAVIGVDVINQFGGTMSAKPAMAPAAEFQSGSTNVALAQPTAAIAARDASSAPPASSSAASSVASSRAPEPTKAPAPAGAAPAALPPAPTAAPPRVSSSAAPPSSSAVSSSAAPRLGTSETSASDNLTATTAAKAIAVPTATPLPTSTPTETPTPVPSATLASSPTAPLVAQAKTEPTRAPVPQTQSRTATPAEIISPLRIAEIMLFFLAIFFGSLVILLRRK